VGTSIRMLFAGSRTLPSSCSFDLFRVFRRLAVALCIGRFRIQRVSIGSESLLALQRVCSRLLLYDVRFLETGALKKSLSGFLVRQLRLSSTFLFHVSIILALIRLCWFVKLRSPKREKSRSMFVLRKRWTVSQHLIDYHFTIMIYDNINCSYCRRI
jgi:hypothetical protein